MAQSTRSGLALALAALCAAGLGCKKKEQPSIGVESAQGTKPPVAVHFVQAQERTLPRRYEAAATLDADQRSEVAINAPGTVTRVAVDIGDRVKKGDLLVELDPREAALRLQTAAASAEQQRARLGMNRQSPKFERDTVPDLRAAKEALDLATTAFARTEALFNEKAVPKSRYDEAKANRERAQANYDAARNGVDQAFAGLSAAEAQARLSAKGVDDTKVRAPFDGVIAERRISEGEFAGMGRVVVVLVKDDPLRLKFDIPESAVGSVEVGANVELRVAAFPDRVFQGSVRRVGAALRPQSRTLPIEAEVQNHDRALKVGFFAQASVALAGAPIKALVVPRKALQSTGIGFRVFVRNGNTVAERLVTLGQSAGDMVEVKGKLVAGDEVATDSLHELSDSSAIMTVP